MNSCFSSVKLHTFTANNAKVNMMIPICNRMSSTRIDMIFNFITKRSIPMKERKKKGEKKE